MADGPGTSKSIGKSLALWGGALLLLSSAQSAHGATKLCFKTKVEVPQDARFIVKRSRAITNGAKEVADPSATKFKRPAGAVLTDIDENYASVVVSKSPGDSYEMNPVGRGCGMTHYVVVEEWQPTETKTELVAAKLHTWEGYSHARLHLSWREYSSRRRPTWTRIDWAYSARDLDDGLYGSNLGTRGSGAVNVVPDFHVVHVRLTEYLLDGSERMWRGWVQRQPDGQLRFGEGQGSAGLHKSSPSKHRLCSTQLKPRPVPTNAQFSFYGSVRPRMLATTLDGKALPISFIGDHYSVEGLQVQVAPGTVFRLQKLPIVPGCRNSRPLVATDDRTHDVAPRILDVRAHHFDYSKQYEGGDVWDDLQFHIQDAPSWGKLELEWAYSRAELGSGVHVSTHEPVRVYVDGRLRGRDDPGLLPKEFVLLFVRITPTWADGSKSTAWEGWVHRDPSTRAVTFASLVEEEDDLVAPNVVAVNEPALMTTRSYSCCSLGVAALFLGWLAFVLLLRKFPIATRTPFH